jgi:hypothetical protein
MTQNKFWLVWQSNVMYNQHKTQELAIKEAKKLASVNQDNTYYVFEATHSFKADVNGIKTSFQVTPTDFDKRCTPKQEFKVGDRVQYNFSRYQTGFVTEVGYKNIKIEVDGHEHIPETITDDARFFKLL